MLLELYSVVKSVQSCWKCTMLLELLLELLAGQLVCSVMSIMMSVLSGILYIYIYWCETVTEACAAMCRSVFPLHLCSGRWHGGNAASGRGDQHPLPAAVWVWSSLRGGQVHFWLAPWESPTPHPRYPTTLDPRGPKHRRVCQSVLQKGERNCQLFVCCVYMCVCVHEVMCVCVCVHYVMSFSVCVCAWCDVC